MRLARPLGMITVAVVVAFALPGCSSGPAVAAAGAGSTGPGSSAASNATQPSATSAQGAPQTAEAPIQLGTKGIDGLIAEYDARCKSETVESLDCESMRSLLVAEVTIGLLKIEKSGDQRGTEEALGAFDLLDEPEILISAMRVLGHFPETPNLAERVVPLLLESPYMRVQSMAADVLIANPGAGFQDLGRMWSEGHNEMRSGSAYDEYPDLPAHYDSMGFPNYAGSEWFSAADSDRSIGWSTKDDVDTVARWYGNTLHAELIDADKYNELTLQQAQVSFATSANSPLMTRMQQLMDRAMKGDQSALPEIDKLKEQLDKQQAIEAEAEKKSAMYATNLPGSFATRARWIVAAKKGERISKIVVVFPIPEIQRTIIKEVWNLSDYPSAWPKEASR